MEFRNQHIEAPYFSICIPQYNRTSFLLEAIRCLSSQDFRDFEICIADDCSTDGRAMEIVELLDEKGIAYAYRRNDKNLRYDGNLRASISLARGRYCLLHGNDDCLKDSGTLTRLRDLLEENGRPSVAVTNFETWNTGQVTRRLPKTALYAAGPETAVAHFRNVAFVTGVLIDRKLAEPHATARWDGSEMYQMFLMARVISLGGTLLEIEESLVRQNIQVPGETVDSAVRAPKVDPCPIVARRLPMTLIGQVIADAIRPGLSSKEQGRALNARILKQLYLFTLPRWIVVYRTAQSWKYALGIALGQSPLYVCKGIDLSIRDRAEILALHLAGCSVGLTVPQWAYYALEPRLHGIAKGH
ncbi:MAG: glycosyltransferase family 2 protein [Polyangiaceae bacterium]